MSLPREIALKAKAWPFEEARKLLARYQTRKSPKNPENNYVLFEMGYGPSGLPHIGTFGEGVRTSMVRRAFELLSDIPTEFFCFSDDMDGLRKVPDNVPNREMLAQFLGKPLTQVPDPFGTHPSFGEHNNARLQAFLDGFGFRYQFKSATAMYKSGAFDAALLQMLKHYDAVMAIMLPSLRSERQATYSPFLPICPRKGVVLQVPTVARDEAAGTIAYRDPETHRLVELPVIGGHCKLQWKADWAMRWLALEVDYEMAGKDLIPSVELAGKIVKALGGTPPDGFNYELFLDQNGEKISKSKGNGLSVEDWLTYAPDESLALFMYQQPRRAKRLYFDVIPKAVDEYLNYLDKIAGEPYEKQAENPVWHVHAGHPPEGKSPLSFAILLNLASVVGRNDESVLWGFISRYAPGTTPGNNPLLAKLVRYAGVYYRDFVAPAKKFRPATEIERKALAELADGLKQLPTESDAETFQDLVYEIGKRHPFPELRDWFKGIYEVLLGQQQGPRFGSFIALYGRDNSVALIERALSGNLTAA